VSPNKDLSLAFAQLTVALRSTQRFAAFNARGARVAGDEAQLVRVQDHWVLERAIGAALPDSMRKWRLAGRLNSAALQKTA
jgi:large subunit ribosomal protein L45